MTMVMSLSMVIILMEATMNQITQMRMMMMRRMKEWKAFSMLWNNWVWSIFSNALFFMDFSIMFWNVQGALSPEF